MSGSRDSDSSRLMFLIKSKADISKTLNRVKVTEQEEVRQCTNNDTWARDKDINLKLTIHCSIESKALNQQVWVTEHILCNGLVWSESFNTV